jgi:hypothetical protein
MSNSKIIYLRRTKSFIEQVQTTAQEFMALSQQSVGSYWAGNNSRAVGTGLSFEEQQLLLPYTVDCEPADRQFREKVKNFYTDIRTKIPFGEEGLPLEIGLSLDNDQPVTYHEIDKETGKKIYNLPIRIEDYIRYRHAVGDPKNGIKGHPAVSPSIADSKGNQLIRFYVFDPSIEDALTNKTTKRKDVALEKYLSIKDDDTKVTAMLVILGVPSTQYPKNDTGVALRTQHLRKLAVEEHERFLKGYAADNFETRVLIQRMLDAKIFSKTGETIYDTGTTTIIGNTLKDVIVELEKDENSEKVLIWRQALQEAETGVVKKAVTV